MKIKNTIIIIIVLIIPYIYDIFGKKISISSSNTKKYENRYYHLIQCDSCMTLVETMKQEIKKSQPYVDSTEKEIKKFYQDEYRIIDVMEKTMQSVKDKMTLKEKKTKYMGFVQFAQDIMTEYETFFEEMIQNNNTQDLDFFCTNILNICNEHQPLFFS